MYSRVYQSDEPLISRSDNLKKIFSSLGQINLCPKINDSLPADPLLSPGYLEKYLTFNDR